MLWTTLLKGVGTTNDIINNVDTDDLNVDTHNRVCYCSRRSGDDYHVRGRNCMRVYLMLDY